MRIQSLILATMLLAGGVSTSRAAAPKPPPLPTMEFAAFFFLFPWMGPLAEMLDPVDVNSIDILFDTIEDPDANDNPHHP